MNTGIDVGKIAALNSGQKLGCIIGTGVLVGVGAWFLLISPEMDNLEVLTAKEATLRAEFTEKNDKAKNLPAYKKQLEEIEKSFDTLLAQLPEKSEMDALLNDINLSGVQEGLEFDMFKPAPNEVLTDIYAEMPVQTKVVGTYTDFGKFAANIAKLPRIVNLTDIKLTLPPADKNAQPKKGETQTSEESNKMVMEATIKTYRYLDQTEIAARREEAKKAKKKSQPTPPQTGAK